MFIRNLLITGFITIFNCMLSGQEYAVDKNAVFLNFAGSYSNQSGIFVKMNSDDAATSSMFSTSINYFAVQNFFVGLGFEISDQSRKNYSSKSFAIGPQMGYMIGHESSAIYPFFDMGVRYESMSYDDNTMSESKASGVELFIGAGTLIPVQKHIGFVFFGEYHMYNLKDKEEDDNELIMGEIIVLGIGIVGLLH